MADPIIVDETSSGTQTQAHSQQEGTMPSSSSQTQPSSSTCASSSATAATTAVPMDCSNPNSCLSSLSLFQVLTPPTKSIVERTTTTTTTSTNPDDDGDPSQQLQEYHQSTILMDYQLDAPAWECTFSQNGEWLAACYGAPDSCVRIWKQQQETSSTVSSCPKWILHATLEGVHERTIRSISFAPIHFPIILAAASFDGTISIWENSLDYNKIPSKKRTSSNEDSSDDWECTTQLEGHESEVKCVRWNATGSLLATCGRDKTVWIWEAFLPGTIGGGAIASTRGGSGDFECLSVLNGHEADVKCVVFAPSYGQWGEGDEIVLSASYDDSIKVWAEEDGDWYCAVSLDNVHTDTIWCLAVAPSGCRVVSASADSSVAILKAYTVAEQQQQQGSSAVGTITSGCWKCVGKLPDAHRASSVYSIHCAPSRAGHGRIVSGGSDNRIQIYREVLKSTSDQPLFELDTVVTTSHGDINCVRWHPNDGSILCSAGDDGTVRLWKYKPY